MAAQDDSNPGKVTQYLGAAGNAALVSPDDSNDLTKVTRGLLVGTAGAIKLTMIGGQTIVIPNVPAGFYPWRITRIWNSSTTATQMVAFW